RRVLTRLRNRFHSFRYVNEVPIWAGAMQVKLHGPWCGAARRLIRMAAWLMVLSAVGCGPPAEVRPVLIPVQGSLLVNGKPAAGAMVVFHPAGGASIDERGSRPKATVLPDGSFEVTTYQAGDGAPAGDYDVAV